MQGDHDLVMLARHGSQEAFAALVDLYKNRVYRTVFHIIGNEQDAQDLTQELFLKLHRSLNGFNGASEFTTWLHRLTVNLALDHLRARRRKPLPVSLEAVSDQPDGSSGIEAGFLRRERNEALAAVMKNLPPKYRQILLLRHYQHLTYAQIAAHIRVPVRTVETRLYRARALLRKALRAAGEGASS
ncbi:MAG: sigma-70 family RNA polymerase sigma factor [Firmicutes bacterium]|nr:sigma-70 family RNA polymerase sigma factor [Bacillota bacterium]